ncbi:MAG TPA: serine/threonine-protein kinase, partial [Kofleriaceae bacterium]
VYEAVHTLLPRRAALKVMHSELLRQPGMATRMVQEAAILEDVKHIGIVKVFECNLLPDRRPYIAMELVDGESLAQKLQKHATLPSIEVARIVGEIAEVLGAVHARGIVHRDLKPDNVLLTTDGTLRVIDWGVARLGTAGRLTLEGMTPGTPIYMSPEQATGRNIGAPCDIYSLGVMAYEMMAGHPPFDGRSLAEVVAMHLTSEAVPLSERTCAPLELCDLVHRMLIKEPGHRPTANQVRRLAMRIAGIRPEPARLEPPRHDVGRMDVSPYAEITITDHGVHDARAVRMQGELNPPISPSGEVVVVDPESLEHGTTEMLPVVRRPRWTPEFSPAVQNIVTVPAAARRGAITPRTQRDAVHGEIVLLEKRRA